MRIDLSLIETEPMSFREEAEIPAEDLDASRIVGSAQVAIEGSVRRYESGFWAEGETQLSASLVCARCLEPVPWSASDPFSIELRHRDDAPVEEGTELEGQDLDVIFLEDNELDLAALAAEQLLLVLPMRILCREQCAGLCPSCGSNRNLGKDCGCEPTSDPRWDALKELTGRTGSV